jgi:niacin transporter
MMKNQSIMKLTISGLLIAIGLIIPMFSPLKIVLEPASFTLASHVVIFTAMFISPAMAVSVALGTTLGFFLGSFPVIVVLRASTHVVFALAGALYLRKISRKRLSIAKLRLFSLCIAAIHASGELVVVSIFYFEGNISPAHLEQGFITSVLLLVGLGTVIHSMIDFEISRILILPLEKQKIWQSIVKYQEDNHSDG